VRNMSFAMTTEQVRNQSKTVTRRFGWWFLKPGDVVQPVVKGMGLKKGEKVEKIGPPIRIVSTRTEALRDMTDEDCVREGFPEMDRVAFINVLCLHYRTVGPCTYVNRIEFEYLDNATGERPETRSEDA